MMKVAVVAVSNILTIHDTASTPFVVASATKTWQLDWDCWLVWPVSPSHFETYPTMTAAGSCSVAVLPQSYGITDIHPDSVWMSEPNTVSCGMSFVSLCLENRA